MSLNKTLLAFALGLAIAACSNGLADSPQDVARAVAQHSVGRGGPSPYATEFIKAGNGWEVTILTDYRRRTVCYMSVWRGGSSYRPAMSCVPLSN